MGCGKEKGLDHWGTRFDDMGCFDGVFFFSMSLLWIYGMVVEHFLGYF